MSQGFSDAALRVFVPRILAQVEKMCMLLEQDMDSRQGWTKSRDMAPWCKVFYALYMIKPLMQYS